MKRAQAALEFLTTYGWAFLVILVMIGALAYFGVLRPDAFVSERCNFGIEFLCDKDKMLATSVNIVAPADGGSYNVKFLLKNKLGKQVTIDDVVINDPPTGAGGLGTCTTFFGATNLAGAGTATFAINAETEVEIDCTTGSFLEAGRKTKFEFTINYYTDVNYPKQQKGEVYINVP
ncbi:hypothetical protein C4573_02740 [Candidatus Woesearchaeota archaeon]|nr:MAG: hypothetical protein C4573_02740 [Candidatus Woesearchaeota archaeon]